MAGTDKKSQQPEQKAMVRERLLVSALDLFAARGYAATTVREIVAAAGVSKPVLYYYFGNKEGIYLELMQNTYATFMERTSILKSFSGTARERVIHFCTGFFDGVLEHIDAAKIIYSIYFGPPQGAPFFPLDRYFDEMHEIIRVIFREGIAGGELRNVDETDAAWAIISALNSSMEEQICHTPPRIERDRLVRMIDLVFNGVSRV